MRVVRTNRLLRAGAVLAALALGCAVLAVRAARAHDRDDRDRAPGYVVDAFWPKQLPNQWLIGQVGGLAVDKHGHIWVNQRPRTLTDDEMGAVPNPPTRTEPRSQCCRPAPSIMEFDVDGNLLRAWGGPVDPDKCVAPACIWPANEHGMFVDDDDNVWIAGNGATDRMVLKFKTDGTFVMMIGGSFAGPADSSSTTSVGRAADFFVDTRRNEVYVADGYLNHRVVKFNATTGAFIAAWGAYGNPPVDPVGPVTPDANNPSFANPVHCVVLSRDDILYVCDRVNNRIQEFDRNGHFLGQMVFDPATRGNGAIWDISLSPDRRQRELLYADGENNFVRILDRTSGAIVGQFGHNGRNAGYFHWVHQMGIDRDGNVYTGEVDTAKRIQKFIPVGRGGDDDRD